MRDGGPAERLLETAAQLFMIEGIRAVGVDRILAEANAARASLYSAFGSKDGLIVAYLEARDARDRAVWASAADGVADPMERALLPFDLAESAAVRRLFRGCPYLNALTEFPEPNHPVGVSVCRHRDWLAAIWSQESRALGIDMPGPLVARLTVLYDGGLAGSKVTKSVEPFAVAREMAAQLLGGARKA